jgi:1-acyl-sn-glycerol-3-phosphate acyltransferase
MDLLYFSVAILFVFLLITFKKVLSKINEANIVDWQHGWANRVDGLLRIFCHRFHGLPKEYIQLPETGSALVAANHISGLDPLLLIAASKRPLRFLIAREEYERYGLKWLFKAAGCIPVDRFTNPEKALRQALLAMDRGEVVAIFPQGGIHWPITESSRFRIKGGAVKLAQRKKVPMYPVVVDGVSLKGSTFLAIFKRSQAKLTFEEKMDCKSMSYDECMVVLAQKLNKVI